MMMEGTFSFAMKNALIRADAHGAHERQGYGDPVRKPQAVGKRVLGHVESLAEIHREDARQRDDASHRHVEVAGDQEEGDADAEDDDEPVVRDEVDDVLQKVEVRHHGAGNAEKDHQDPDHEQGEERLVAHPAQDGSFHCVFRFHGHAPVPAGAAGSAGVTAPPASPEMTFPPVTMWMIFSLSTSQPFRSVAFMEPSNRR